MTDLPLCGPAVTRPFEIGEPRVTPADLKPGVAYQTPMGPSGPVLIVSVGPKWITFRESTYRGWGPRQRLLRSGWEEPYFHEIPMQAAKCLRPYQCEYCGRSSDLPQVCRECGEA